MQHVDFVQVGYVTTPFEIWIYAVTAILAVPTAFTKTYRMLGIFGLTGAVLDLWFKPPGMLSLNILVWSLIAGSFADQARRKERRTAKENTTLLVSMVLWSVVSIFINQGGNSASISGSTFSGYDRTVGTNKIDRTHLEIICLTKSDGRTVEWRIQPTNAAKEPYVVRLPGRGLYATGFLHYLTSDQVADQIAKWAGVKPFHCSYEEYVEMGRHDLAKP
jgi:hypothetical protein